LPGRSSSLSRSGVSMVCAPAVAAGEALAAQLTTTGAASLQAQAQQSSGGGGARLWLQATSPLTAPHRTVLPPFSTRSRPVRWRRRGLLPAGVPEDRK
jgi:hypothetical protein